MEDTNHTKNLSRQIALKRRSELPEDYIRAAGDSIQARVLAMPSYAAADSLFVYVGIAGEPPTGRIIRQALEDGKRVYIPKCVGRHEMLAVRIRSTDGLVPGAFGIPEPSVMSETITADKLDLILVPCLSASPDGRRLGHGAGCYDRFLAERSDHAVCLCFRRMLDPEIPTQAHDITIPRVLSEEI